MSSETEDLTRTLIWTTGMISHAKPDDLKLIAAAYREARELVATIPTDNGDARPRIVACFARSDIYRAADNIACVGWILTAIQERVNERNLPHWRQLRKIVNVSVKIISGYQPTLH